MPHATLKTTFVYLLLQATLTNTAKNTARPVHEVINEQARVEDKRHLPYTNPLARTSNAKLHAEHQQAMFNAERVRQHRAQTQRWMMIPRVDSYMKAYQESQENHQLALEQMQSKLNKRPMKTRQEVKTRQELKTLQAKEIKEIQVPELTKITKADAIVVNDKNRNQRSYGSLYYTPQKLNIAPSTIYDQGITIKPNGNIGVNKLDDETKLYSEAVPSIVKYVYPKLYSQMHNYHSAEDIQALNYMLNKPAKEQLLELNTLIQSNKESEKELNTPTDLHFYLKDPSLLKEQIYSAPYATEYLNNYKDEKPITEEVDDIEDPNQFTNVKTYGVQVTSATPTNVETTTINSHYYNLELEQPYHPQDVQYPQYAVIQEKPTLETLTYEKPTFEALTYEKPSDDYTKEENSKYLHHESTGVQYLSQGLQQLSHGVQHLSQDGTEVSAYADDDVSKINLRKKRDLDSNPFLLTNDTGPREIVITKLDTTPFFISDKNISQLKLNMTMLKVDKNITESVQSNTTLVNVLNTTEMLPKPEELKYRLTPVQNYDYEDYEFSSPEADMDYESDYETGQYLTIPKIIPDARTSFSNRHNSYITPNYGHGGLEQYEFPLGDWFHPASHGLEPIEPVYMLTESQLRSLLGHHNLNVQHLDYFHWTKPKRKHPRKHKRTRNGPKHLRKLKKLHKLIRL